jgi:cytochrome c553
MVHRMSTVVEIESAVDKLSPQEIREFAAWFEQRQAMLNAAEATFLAYDEEEGETLSWRG